MKPRLVGQKIVAIRRAHADPVSGRPALMTLELEDGTVLWPADDDKLPPSIMASDTNGGDWALSLDYKETR